MRNRLLVGNLSFSATPEELRAFFVERGCEVREIDFGPRERWRLPRGYAVVTLLPETDPLKAIAETDGQDFQGRKLLVEGMKPRQWRFRSERVA